MSISSTTTQPPPHNFYSYYPHDPPHSIAQNHHSLVNPAVMPYNTSPNPSQPTHPEQAQHSYSIAYTPFNGPRDVSSSKGSVRKTDWQEFYKNGIPKEVIVIDDDSPSPHAQQRQGSLQALAGASSRPANSNGDTRHIDKRRRTDGLAAYNAVYVNHQPANNENSSNSLTRTASGVYSTAPTSIDTTNGQKYHSRIDEHAGQKRKHLSRDRLGDDDFDMDVIVQHRTWANYVPPPKPPVKASDVYVNLVRDTQVVGQKVDDDDGHYIVLPDTELTERYKIVKLLGQGTFGKVVEAYDKRKGTRCAVKIIRAVPKYRDASRIELRVLATLASNDKYNRNKCIHLRDCFDFRNHICIVTDLLGQSVFDFLKLNQFTPFPSTHIQSFARQLFTSVAFLHDLNLIHTDLKPENILLVTSAYQTFTYNRTVPSSSRGTTRTAQFRKVLLDPDIRLIDFGSATFDDEYHSSVVSTRHYRAPEIILNLGWSFPCDIWSIGCILVEFFTGDALFQTHDNLEHLAMMEAVCNGKIDKDIVAQCRAGRSNNKNSAAQYFAPRAFRLDYPNPETPRASRKYVKNMKTLRETIPSSSDFNVKFLDLLRRIFVYDPSKRITAKQALAHPWFKEALQDDGTEALKIRLQREAAALVTQQQTGEGAKGGLYG